jgi:hypothetical protein
MVLARFPFSAVALSSLVFVAVSQQVSIGSSLSETTPQAGPITPAPTSSVAVNGHDSSGGGSYEYEFIDQISAYYSLPSCANANLSTVVRGMYYGCGDDHAMTSHDCFCRSTSSWSRMNYIIASQVFDNCNSSLADADSALSDAGSAVAVFATYCDQIPMAVTTTSTFENGTAGMLSCYYD